MGDFLGESSEGEIHVRDHLQFELKSEFFIQANLKENTYKQEIFLFIPTSLQINHQTYSKKQFYLDQTTLIRYRTPLMNLSDLVNRDYFPSPLHKLQHFFNQSELNLHSAIASDELKLFGAIFKAAVREKIHHIVEQLSQSSTPQHDFLLQVVTSLCSEISQVSYEFRQLQEKARTRSDYPQLIRHFKYIDEFISTTIDEHLVSLLKQLRSLPSLYSSIDKQIVELILSEKSYRKKKHMGPKNAREHKFTNESIFYRQGLLNRFVLEALMLKNYRFSLEEKHQNILGAMSAGLAMLVYMILFVWKSSVFVINSFPFVALAVIFYILKDRIKEGFKNLYYQQSYRWFPDYSTEIQSPKGYQVGKLKENFAFINDSQLPPGFLKIRNHHFKEELQALQHHETIIQYKREMVLYRSINYHHERRRELMTIFRFNIHRFLLNASNAFELYHTLDASTTEISERFLPKVYHLNLIIRNTYLQNNLTPKIEIKIFRVVVDKGGIKRVEPLNFHHDAHRTFKSFSSRIARE